MKKLGTLLIFFAFGKASMGVDPAQQISVSHMNIIGPLSKHEKETLSRGSRDDEAKRIFESEGLPKTHGSLPRRFTEKSAMRNLIADRAELDGTREKCTVRHREIIDSVAKLPGWERKINGGSRVNYALTLFQREGLSDMKGITVRKYLSDSARKQGFNHFRFSHAHKRILKDVAFNKKFADYSPKGLFEIASELFHDSSLPKVSLVVFRYYLKKIRRSCPCDRPANGPDINRTDMVSARNAKQEVELAGEADNRDTWTL
jgi:hypothetical protein